MTTLLTETRLTPTQRDVFDRLLVIGADRPTMPPGLPERLADRIVEGTREAAENWAERLWISKSPLNTVLQCETLFLERQQAPANGTLSAPAAVGIVTHRAVQLSYTHAHLSPDEWVAEAISASLREPRFAAFWNDQPAGVQSDLLMQILGKTLGFIDSFPPVQPSWSPQFEAQFHAKVGRLTLAARVDLMLGRPRADGRQTMLLTDLKTGDLHDGHIDEAMYYALVSTLRYGVAPFRSTVFSIASGDWTDPEVTEQRLMDAADRVILGVNTHVELLTDKREPTRQAGGWCSWCPINDTCPNAFQVDAGRVERAADPVQQTAVAAREPEEPNEVDPFAI